MKVYSFSQARQNLSKVLNRAKSEKVFIRRRGGDVFRIAPEKRQGSPLDIPSIKTNLKTEDILDIIREVRER